MKELITQFGVDWKLLLAQVVNFALLLYLLKRFAYGPIIIILNERRKKIEEGIKAREESQKKLAEAEEEKKHVLLKAEEHATKIVTKAEGIAEKQAKEIVTGAHKESEHIVTSGRKKLEEERLTLEEEVEKHAHNLIREGLKITLGRMNPTERDDVLIQEALKTLKTQR